MKDLSTKKKKIPWRSFFHPLQISFTLGVIVFFAYFVLLLAAFDTTPLWVTSAAYLIITFLLGLGGCVIIIHKAYINQDGEVEEGCWAYILGGFSCLLGWGSFIFLVFFTFFAESP
jgi:hypothetical protein